MNARKKKIQPKGKIDTIEKLAMLVADGFAEVRERLSDMDVRFDEVYERLDRIDARLSAMDARFDTIDLELGSIRSRLDQLEEQGVMQSGYAKETDYLFERIARIEKHLNLS